jgi:hypothetical protein
MKRQVRLLVLGLALGIAGCAVGSEGPIDEQTGEQSAELGSETGSGTQGTPGSGTGSVGRPADLVKASSGDPSGPTPYPWQESDDPSGGPTPYPWDDDTDDQSDGTQPAGNTSGAGSQQTQTTNH